tara:strand:+ start:861 stop:968 length:108 start_codon:yes stop_codon:yes gene_type:complete
LIKKEILGETEEQFADQINQDQDVESEEPEYEEPD